MKILRVIIYNKNKETITLKNSIYRQSKYKEEQIFYPEKLGISESSGDASQSGYSNAVH